MERVDIQNETKVQPGWIYVRKDGAFFPPLRDLQLPIEEEGCKFQVNNHSQDELKRLKGKVDDLFWEKDANYLKPGELFSIITCSVSKIKKVQEQEQMDISYEYAIKVFYRSSIAMMVTYYKNHDFHFEKFKNQLIKMWNGEPNSNTFYSDVQSRLQSIKIYPLNTSTKGKFTSKLRRALTELIEDFKDQCVKNNLDSICADVNLLPSSVENQSEYMCALQSTSETEIRKQNFVGKFFSRVFHHNFGICENDANSINDPNIPKAFNALADNSHYQHHCNTSNRCDAAAISSCLVKTAFQSNSKYEPPKTVIETKEVNISSAMVEYKGIAKYSQESTKDLKAGEHEKSAKQGWDPLNLPKDMNGPETKFSPDKDNHPPNKTKLKNAFRIENVQGFDHHYYYASFHSSDVSEQKTLLLFGSDDRSKLSVLNLLFRCSQNVEKGNQSKLIVDSSSEIDCISFYHFGFPCIDVKELIVIITPKMKEVSLGRLQTLLADGTLNVHALGFVINSRSETLTSEERSFFSFIRSSFGEVSNQHLMTFLTFCDVSRNFPVLDEMKTQSIKSKCTLELNNFEIEYTKELDILETALVMHDIKKSKKLFKTLKDLPHLSVKSTKVAQEKTFAATHLSDSFKALITMLKEFVTLVETERDIKENVEPIWKMVGLVLAMEGNGSSEDELLKFIATLLVDNCSDAFSIELLSKCFLLLVFNCPERNVTTSLLVTLKYQHQLFSTLHINPRNINTTIHSTTALIGEFATFFCKHCKDIHNCKRDVMEETMTLSCNDCQCYADVHTLWTLQDSVNLLSMICNVAFASLDVVLKHIVLPQSPFIFTPYLYMNVLLQIFPQYHTLIEAIISKCAK